MEEGTNNPNQNIPPSTNINHAAKQNIIAYSQNKIPGNNDSTTKSKVKKIIIIGFIIFIVLTIIFSLIYLLTSNNNSPVKENVEITYWGLWEDPKIANSIITEFERENPNIKVIYEYQDPKDYKEKVIARIDAGRGPDVFSYHNSWQSDLLNKLLPLTRETIEREEFESKYYKVAQQDLIKNGAIYGIPLEVDTLALFVNPTLVEQVENENSTKINLPQTWQEFIEVSAILTKKDEQGKITIGGAGIGTYDNVNYSPDIISLLFAQNRVDLENFQESQIKISGALRFYTNFSLVENNVWAQNIDPDLLAFTQGRLALFFGYSKDYQTIKKTNPGLIFQVIPVPQLLSAEKFNIANYFAEGVSINSKNQNEAMMFMKFLARPETQEKLFQEQSKINSFGSPYSNKNLADKLLGTDAYVFVDQAKTAVSSPFSVTPSEFSKEVGFNLYLKTAVNSILSGNSPEDAAEGLLQSYAQGFGSQVLDELTQ